MCASSQELNGNWSWGKWRNGGTLLPALKLTSAFLPFLFSVFTYNCYCSVFALWKYWKLKRIGAAAEQDPCSQTTENILRISWSPQLDRFCRTAFILEKNIHFLEQQKQDFPGTNVLRTKPVCISEYITCYICYKSGEPNKKGWNSCTVFQFSQKEERRVEQHSTLCKNPFLGEFWIFGISLKIRKELWKFRLWV